MLERGKETGQNCLRCHAPLAHLAGDSNPNSPAADEGVSCSYCHSIVSSNGGNIDTCYKLDSSGVFYGPYEPGQSTDHGSAYSKLHLTADLCIGCHDYVNEFGVPVLETYSEWKAWAYPENEIHCQNCHMPIMYDLSVASNVETPNQYVTAHEFRGGQSKINLTHAVDLKTDVTRTDQRLNVTVSITNAESGHKLPTGVPVRKLVLNVVMKTNYNVEIGAVRRVYRKVLTDEYGTIIENVPDMFLNATRIFSDNRIGPKETRVENFTFDIPKWATNYNIETSLTYEYSRRVLSEELISVEMGRNVVESRSIK
jgi:DNA-directed RNA polymerase subunit RPC12/RpoP